MASGIRIPFVADVKQFLSGTKNVEQSLEQVEDSLDDIATQGEQATERLEDSFKDLADSADTSFSEIRRSAKDAGDGVSTSLREGGGKAGAVGSEIGAEFSENIGEGLRSGDYVGTLEETFTSLAGALGPIGIGIGVGAAIVFNMIRGMKEQSKKFLETYSSFLGAVDEETRKIKFADTFKSEVTKFGEAFTESEDDTVKFAEGLKELAKVASDAGVPLKDLVRLFSGQLDPALTNSDEKLAAYAQTQTRFVTTSTGELRKVFLEGGAAANAVAEQLGIVVDATDATTDAIALEDEAMSALIPTVDTLRTTTRNVTEETKDWKDAISDASDAALEAIGGVRDYEAAIDDITASIEDNGRTLDLSTEKGRANSQALESLIAVHLARRDAMIAEGKSQAEVNAFLATAKGEVAGLADQMTNDQGTIDTYANTLNGIPPTITTDVHVNTPKGAEAEELRKFTETIAALKLAGENPINIKARVEHTEVAAVLARTAGRP